MGEIIFVTGTGTGVGKTILTAMLLHFCRQEQRGKTTIGMKPFCSGGRGDARLLWNLQDREVSLDEVNPFYFEEPLAPAVAAARAGGSINKEQALRAIGGAAARCDRLLVEGAGGLLSPLGNHFSLFELIGAFEGARVLLAGPNRLGIINDVLLNAGCLKEMAIERSKVVLMGVAKPDLSNRFNAEFLRKETGCEVVEVPFLGRGARKMGIILQAVKKNKKTLARLI